jgi:surface antigen
LVDFEPSNPLDDLFGFGETTSLGENSSPPAAQYGSRREARGASVPVRSTARSKRAAKAMARSAKERRKLSRGPDDRKAVAKAIRASHPKGPKKHPLSVLATMAVVGGMFAVAGLPAYATINQQLTSDEPVATVQSMVVSSDASPLAPVRDGYKATTPDQLAQMSKDALRAANNAEYLASGARELGDDYPWPYELASYQGGGLSPLNYYYRECVDFVAWRLNRDQGYYAEPFKWVWSTLTPTGGNAYQWLYAWQAHGWTVSKTPVVGAVAWFGSDHVSYVKAILDGGFVLIEEYNFVPGVYSQRTLPIGSVSQFLYPPT